MKSILKHASRCVFGSAGVAHLCKDDLVPQKRIYEIRYGLPLLRGQGEYYCKCALLHLKTFFDAPDYIMKGCINRVTLGVKMLLPREAGWGKIPPYIAVQKPFQDFKKEEVRLID